MSSVRLSVMLSPPKPVDEIQPNSVCELLTWMGSAKAIFLCVCGPDPWGGVKRSNIINFNYKVNFKDFYTKLCVCSHKWKIQNISDGIFILLPGSYPRCGTLGGGGGGGGLGVPRGSKKKSFLNMVMWHLKLTGMTSRRGWGAEKSASKIFILGSNWWPWGEVKRSNIIKFQLPCQFQWFLCSHK